MAVSCLLLSISQWLLTCLVNQLCQDLALLIVPPESLRVLHEKLFEHPELNSLRTVQPLVDRRHELGGLLYHSQSSANRCVLFAFPNLHLSSATDTLCRGGDVFD